LGFDGTVELGESAAAGAIDDVCAIAADGMIHPVKNEPVAGLEPLQNVTKEVQD
jgi:hypothetical protein